jgi:hypothetical protein
MKYESLAKKAIERHKVLGTVKVVKLICNAYLLLAIGVVTASLLGLAQGRVELPPVLSGPAMRPDFIPIGLAHVLLFMNATSVYDYYFLLWDEEESQQYASIALCLVHLAVLVLSTIYPRLWTCGIAVICGAVLLRNVSVKRAHLPESPVQKVQARWLPRLKIYTVVAAGGALLTTLPQLDWFYVHILHVNVVSPDVRIMADNTRRLLSWTAFAIVALCVVFPRLEFVPRYSSEEIEAHREEMSSYLSGAVEEE